MTTFRFLFFLLRLQLAKKYFISSDVKNKPCWDLSTLMVELASLKVSIALIRQVNKETGSLHLAATHVQKCFQNTCNYMHNKILLSYQIKTIYFRYTTSPPGGIFSSNELRKVIQSAHKARQFSLFEWCESSEHFLGHPRSQL